MRAFVVSAMVLSTNGLNSINGISKLHTFENIVQFGMNVLEIDKTNERCLESVEFELHDVTWKIRSCKNYDITNVKKTWLDVSLIAVFSGDTLKWSCRAKANFKLIPEGNEKPLESNFDYYNFNRAESSKKINDFITWDELIDKYVVNDEATLEVAISTLVPNRAPNLERTSAKFEVRVKQLSKLDRQYTTEEIVRGIRWRVLATKMNDHFAVFVYGNDDDMDIHSTWEVSATFRIMSTDGKNSVSKNFSSKKFNWMRSSFGFESFYKWSDLFDPSRSFVIQDATILEIELNVGAPEITFEFD